MTTVVTRGAASAQALGYVSGPTVPVNYIEDVFSTYLYTGNGSTQTITNGIDLSGKGGLTWIKIRGGAGGHRLVDTVRGATKSLESNSTASELTESTGLTSFGATGFSLGADADYNLNTVRFVSWTFREQPKFFDIVTYTGTGSVRTIAHNLGSVPGCIIVRGSSAGTAGYNWRVYHRSLTSAGYRLQLNTTGTQVLDNAIWNSTAPTSTVFTVGTDPSVNSPDDTFVAYLFAHNAGGFGASGTDSVVSCGTYEGNTSTFPVINLGWEPQWLLIKARDTVSGEWMMFDNMRQLPVDVEDKYLKANSTSTELPSVASVTLLPNGFKITGSDSNVNNYDGEAGVGANYIYIAIRRGPMKVPTDATKVFSPNTYTGATTTVTTGFPVDLLIAGSATTGISNSLALARLTAGDSITNCNISLTYLNAVAANAVFNSTFSFESNTGYERSGGEYDWYNPGDTLYSLSFRRAPSYFDMVCYENNGGVATTVPHNLNAIPELMLIKSRTGASYNWQVYSAALAATEYLVFNTTAAKATGTTRWNSTRPTASVFSLGTAVEVNGNSGSPKYNAYLFASAPGVSKVGSYTGTGTTQQINCGFTAGARFVMIKRTDSTGDWYFWDSARGIVAGNDPYLLFNTASAQVTSTDYVDTFASGFEISSTAPAAINANGGSFIFLAIA